tara:strand:- start:435 stop:617 length:183 start_codon:yes stop_codon:yes gene_type:complete
VKNEKLALFCVKERNLRRKTHKKTRKIFSGAETNAKKENTRDEVLKAKNNTRRKGRRKTV